MHAHQTSIDNVPQTVRHDDVICPLCACEWVHPEAVRVYPVKGDTEYEITRRGLQAGSSDAARRQRGVSIVVSFACEFGCKWSQEFRFHEGVTLVYTHAVKLSDGSEESDIQTLWRD